MKTWSTPTIEELDVNQTAYSFSGSCEGDGFYNDATGQIGMYDDLDNQSTDEIIDSMS